ncbi:hypothetical protein J4413_04775 [Candidatus Woesearchaeota archaeon]|nr:hypothetical protein [Candidatus Woesearchaeota archaeon]
MEKTIIKLENVAKTRNSLNKAKGEVILDGDDEKLIRYAIKDKKVKIIINIEKGKRKDFMHSRNSGLNQVLCKLFKERGITVGFNFDLIYDAKEMERVNLLGRMMQNVKLCRKYKVKTAVVDFGKRDEKDLNSFGACIGLIQKEFKIIKC